MYFKCPSKTRLLAEDFNYVFFHRGDNGFYHFFNTLGASVKAYKGECMSDRMDNFTIDLFSGSQCTLEKNDLSILLSCSNGEKTYLKRRSAFPKQFTVANNKIIYYNKNIYYYKKGFSSEWSSLPFSGFNPCRRYENGLYRVKDGFLEVLPFFN